MSEFVAVDPDALDGLARVLAGRSEPIAGTLAAARRALRAAGRAGADEGGAIAAAEWARDCAATLHRRAAQIRTWNANGGAAGLDGWAMKYSRSLERFGPGVVPLTDAAARREAQRLVKDLERAIEEGDEDALARLGGRLEAAAAQPGLAAELLRRLGGRHLDVVVRRIAEAASSGTGRGMGLVDAFLAPLGLLVAAGSKGLTEEELAGFARDAGDDVIVLLHALGADVAPELLAAGAWVALDPKRPFAPYSGGILGQFGRAALSTATHPELAALVLADPRVELLRAVAEDPAATFVLFCGAQRPDYFTAEFFARVSILLPDDGASAVAVASTVLDLTQRAEAGERRLAPAAAALADLVLGLGTVADEVPDGRWAPFVADVVAAYPNALVYPAGPPVSGSHDGVFPAALRSKASEMAMGARGSVSVRYPDIDERTQGFVSLAFADDGEARDDAQRVEEAMGRLARGADGTLEARAGELGEIYGFVTAAQAQRWIAEARAIDARNAATAGFVKLVLTGVQAGSSAGGPPAKAAGTAVKFVGSAIVDAVVLSHQESAVVAEAKSAEARTRARAGVLAVAAWGTPDDVASLEEATGRSLDEIFAALAEPDDAVAAAVIGWTTESDSAMKRAAAVAGGRACRQV